jgi:hypothetical protein
MISVSGNKITIRIFYSRKDAKVAKKGRIIGFNIKT